MIGKTHECVAILGLLIASSVWDDFQFVKIDTVQIRLVNMEGWNFSNTGGNEGLPLQHLCSIVREASIGTKLNIEFGGQNI